MTSAPLVQPSVCPFVRPSVRAAAPTEGVDLVSGALHQFDIDLEHNWVAIVTKGPCSGCYVSRSVTSDGDGTMQARPGERLKSLGLTFFLHYFQIFRELFLFFPCRSSSYL